MKRRIVSILLDKGGVVMEKGRYILHYKTYKDGKYFAHTKEVSQFTEIEDACVDCGLEDIPEGPEGARKIGIRRIIKKGTFDLEEENRWLFISVLHGILVEDVIPVSPVYISKMLVGDNVEAIGVCYVKDKP